MSLALKHLVPVRVKRLIKSGFQQLVGSEIVPRRSIWHDLERLAGSGATTIIDGGAFNGDFAFTFLHSFPRARVFAFEAQLESYRLLEQRAAAEPRIVPINLAISDRDGGIPFYVTTSPLSSGCAPVGDQGRKYHPTQTQLVRVDVVESATLDGWASRESVGAVDVLKLDLQGHELAALRGAERLLERTRIVMVEVEFIKLYAENCLYHEVATYLLARGFELFQLYHLADGTGPDGRLISGDALFFRPESVRV